MLNALNRDLNEKTKAIEAEVIYLLLFMEIN